eukprot:1139077-Pelagomonas_calceolata.AAC.11
MSTRCTLCWVCAGRRACDPAGYKNTDVGNAGTQVLHVITMWGKQVQERRCQRHGRQEHRCQERGCWKHRCREHGCRNAGAKGMGARNTDAGNTAPGSTGAGNTGDRNTDARNMAAGKTDARNTGATRDCLVVGVGSIKMSAR